MGTPNFKIGDRIKWTPENKEIYGHLGDNFVVEAFGALGGEQSDVLVYFKCSGVTRGFYQTRLQLVKDVRTKTGFGSFITSKGL